MTTILIKKKDTAGAPAAGDLTNAAGGAEIAVNTATKRIYTKDSGGNVVEVGTNPTATTMNGNLTFVPDATYDIGASGVTRPRNLFLSGAATLGTALTVPNGGTGLTTLATGSLSYGAGTSAFSTLAIGTAGQILTVNSGATAPQWSTLSSVAVTTFSAGTTGFTPNTATSGAVTLAGTLGTANGGTNLTSFTSGGVVYASSTSALATGSALSFDGTNLGVGNSPVNSGSTTTLTIYNAGASALYLQNSTSGTTSSDGATLQLVASDLTITNRENGYIRFNTNNTEALRIDSSQNVGIGTNGPNRKLYVQSDDSATGGNVVAVRNSNSTAGAFINFLAGGSNAPSMGAKGDDLVFTADGYNGTEWGRFSSGNLGVGISSPTGRLAVGGANTTYDTNVFGQVLVQSTTAYNATPRAGIIFSVKYSSGGSYGVGSSIQGYKENSTDGDFSQGILFTTQQNGLAPAERARITSDGNFLVATTNSAPGSANVSGFAVGSSGYISASRTNVAAEFNLIGLDGDTVVFRRSGTQVGSVSVTTTLTSYNVTSDYRLKNTISPMTGALAKVAQLKPVTYKWNVDGSDCEGFIAHELAEVCPLAVTGAKDALDADGNPKYQGIDVSFLVATLTAAIQEQQAIIESLKARLDAANL